MPYADLGNIKLHYVEEGPPEGDVALFLHGFPDYHASWNAQLPAFAAAGFRAVAPDLRGYNLSEKPERVGAYDIDLLVQDVKGLIGALEAPHVRLVGHDWGGIIAWHFAMRYPEYVERLATVNIPHPAHAPVAWLRNPRQLAKSWYILAFQLPAVPERGISSDDFARLKRLYHSQKQAFARDDIDGCIEAARRTEDMSGPINYYRAYLRASPLRLRSYTRPVEFPVLVLWGDQDLALESHLAEPPEGLAPNAEVVHFPDAGHWLHREKPAEVNEHLIGFFNEDARSAT